MAVRVSKDHGIISQDFGEKTVVAKLFADSKEDVTTDIIEGTLENKPEGYTLDAESYVITADGNIAMLDTEGAWHWVGEDEDAPPATLSLNRPNLLGGFNPSVMPAQTDDAEPLEEVAPIEEEVEESSEPVDDEDMPTDDDMR